MAWGQWPGASGLAPGWSGACWFGVRALSLTLTLTRTLTLTPTLTLTLTRTLTLTPTLTLTLTLTLTPTPTLTLTLTLTRKRLAERKAQLGEEAALAELQASICRALLTAYNGSTCYGSTYYSSAAYYLL